MVNHYQNKEEGFLGWLVAQPVEHRMTFSDLTKIELEEFGVSMQRLERALKRAYDSMFPNDIVEIVYLVRLGESTLATPAEWHVHLHVLPRTFSMRKKCDGWDIHKCRERGIRPEPSKPEIEALMTRIRQYLPELN